MKNCDELALPGGPAAPRWKWWPMIFAAFIIVLPLHPAQPSQTELMLKLNWAGVFIFLALFAAAIDAARKRRPALWIVCAITLLGLAFAPFNSGSAVLFAYSSALAPWFVDGDRRRTTVVVATIVALLTIEVWITALPIRFWLFTVGWCVIAAASYLWVVNMILSLDRVAKMAERERIARDLHDVLGHTLSLITLKSELAGQLLAGAESPDVARARREISDVESISRGALAEVRQTIRGYRSETLQAELDRVAAMLQTAGIRMNCESEMVPLDAVREGVLGMALREAVTNVVRHSRAQNCRIRVRATKQSCQLEVEDDGLGGVRAEGQGLRGMRERIEALGGSVLLDHSGGTRLTVRVPVPS
jgi:two-component system, NarL family, sensor histidine kinase DesK